MKQSKVAYIAPVTDNGNGYLCDIDGETDQAFMHYGDHPELGVKLTAALVPNRVGVPPWFVAGFIEGEVETKELSGVHEGHDDWFYLMSKARLCQRVIAVNGNNVWYAPLGADVYLEEYEV